MKISENTRALIKTDSSFTPLVGAVDYGRVSELIGASTLDSVVLTKRGLLMYVDDQGHARGLKVNPVATALYHEICRPGTTFEIVGDVVLVPINEVSA